MFELWSKIVLKDQQIISTNKQLNPFLSTNKQLNPDFYCIRTQVLYSMAYILHPTVRRRVLSRNSYSSGSMHASHTTWQN